MADDKKTQAPNFYQAAAGMSMPGGGPGGPGGAGSKPGTGAAASGEKVNNVRTLLEVFRKMDKLETDPDAKALIQQMADTAQQYMDKIQGGAGGAGAAGKSKSGAGPSPTGAGATDAMGAMGGETGGAGAVAP